MKQNQLRHYQRKLEQERARIRETLDRMEENQTIGTPIREYTEEISSYDNHPADLGTEMFMAQMGANLETHEKRNLREIEDALERIHQGTYGLCLECGKTIEPERLDLIPETPRCITCAENTLPVEALSGDRGRPKEERLLTPPYERTNMDHRDYTGFDGEDSYQQVAEFNRITKDPSHSGGNDVGIFDSEDSYEWE